MSASGHQRFPIGTTYTPRGRTYRATVVNFLTTTNLNGTVVRTRYSCNHEFCGQIVTDDDVTETTIAMGNPEMPA